MQTHILRTISLIAVGNAALRGRDVSGYWPNAGLFQFDKQVEFVVQQGEKYTQAAADPNAWIAKLRDLNCRGLRLHNAPMQQREGIGPQKERMLVGMVGGGPRWLIETVMPSRCEIWEGYDRLGDKDDPARKIWLSAYVMLGETEPQNDADSDVAAAMNEARSAIGDAAALAQEMQYAENFAEMLTGALSVLNGEGPQVTHPVLDFFDRTDLAPEAKRLLAGATQAWIFGGMGSWNDLGAPDHLAERYEHVSEALFLALTRAAIVTANSTYR